MPTIGPLSVREDVCLSRRVQGGRAGEPKSSALGNTATFAWLEPFTSRLGPVLQLVQGRNAMRLAGYAAGVPGALLQKDGAVRAP